MRRGAPFPIEVAFAVAGGEVLALIGPSGSGKSTILRLIAGLLRPDAGRIVSGGDVWFDAGAGIDLSPQARRSGFVFQDYALFPHMTAAGNVAAALGHLPAADRPARAASLLALVHLDGLGDRRPAALSGGQRQRVALARALGRDPAVLLLDEPFAAVDPDLRRGLQAELLRLRGGLGMPILLVTHDLNDALALADRFVRIEAGRVAAAGDIAALAAGGEEAANLLRARVAEHLPARGLTRLAFDGGTLLLPLLDRPAGSGLRVRIAARDVILATKRPEAISLRNVLEGRVTGLSDGHAGAVLVALMLGPTPLIARITRDAAQDLGLAPGAEVFVLVKSVAVDR